jgi:hypothetical protein
MTAYSTILTRVQGNLSNGIWPQSRSDHYFIFCVGQSLIKINAFMAWAVHNDVLIKPLFGKYKGQTERSFIARMDKIDRIQPWLMAEESILLIGSCNRNGQPRATLKYLATGKRVGLGYMRNVSRETALKQDSWTYCPVTKCYFVCA